MTGLRDTLISESTLVCSIPRRVSLASTLILLLPRFIRIALSLTHPLLRLLISSPPSFTSFSPSSSHRQTLSPSRLLLSLFLHGTRDLCPPSSHATPNPIPLSLGVLSVRLLASRNESSSPILSSFHSSMESFHLVFAFPTLPFYLTIPHLVHAAPPQSYHLPRTI